MWSYERCLQGAPLNEQCTGPERSHANYVWCKTALEWSLKSGGPWSMEEVAARLREVSQKAAQREEHYPTTTAHSASLAIEHNQRSRA